MHIYEKVHQFYKQDYNQIEAMIYLLWRVKPKWPLPPMRGWAISPDFANIVISAIFDHKPKLILECGSGVSTILMSYCLKRLEQSHIWSLDHDKEFADNTRKYLKIHKLDNMATVIHAPLKEKLLKGKSWFWYDTSGIEDIGPFDLFIIDGPPDNIQKMARYPALPLLIDTLSDDAIIIIDDASREDEGNMVKAWLEEFKNFDYEWYNTEKGTIILTKTKKA